MSSQQYIDLSSETRWNSLELSEAEERVLLEQVCNVSFQAYSRSSKTLAELADREGFNLERTIAKMDWFFKQIPDIYASFSESVDLCFYSTSLQPEYNGAAEIWAFQASVAKLNGSERVLFADIKESFNLSAALSVRENLNIDARVFRSDLCKR